MRIEEVNWMDVEEYLKHENRLILVLGSNEQHGYLSLQTDTLIPQALADAASKRTGVLVGPALSIGVSPYFLTYPGSFTLRATTLMDVLEDLVRSAYQQGFKRFLVMNGHGGNAVGTYRLQELVNELPDLKVSWYSWWLSPRVKELGEKYQLLPSHASWMENFPFTRVTSVPAGVKETPPPARRVLNAADTRQRLGDGVAGGAYQVDENIMLELFDLCVTEAVDLLQF